MTSDARKFELLYESLRDGDLCNKEIDSSNSRDKVDEVNYGSKSFDPETTIDIIGLSAESWMLLEKEATASCEDDLQDGIVEDFDESFSLDEGQTEELAEDQLGRYKEMEKYYEQVAIYNRKLELVKQGYFDVFEEVDDSAFQDKLDLSLTGHLTIV